MMLVIGVITALKEQVSTELTAMCLLPFVWDATATVLRRGWQRQPVFEAHRSHVYQRLALGWQSHAWVSMLFAVLALWSAGWAVVASESNPFAPGVPMLHPVAALGLGLLPLVLLTAWARKRYPVV